MARVLVDAVDRPAVTGILQEFLSDGGRHQIVTVNTDFVRLADRDPDYRALLNRADLAVADGMPLVWLSRLVGTPLPERLTGAELIDECCRLAAGLGVGIYLLGAGPGVADAAARTLAVRHEGLRIAGTHSPPFAPATTEADARLVELIRDAGRCVLFVAFGAPRQDRFIAAHLAEMDAPIAMGVGCAFDILAGAIPRAPAWMQGSGLEWLWRLLQEPRRLWRRYLVEDIPFLLKLGVTAVRDGRAAVEPS